MPIQRQNIPINFALGLDTKTDPKQVSIGKFLALNNSVFTTGGRLTKRNGNALLTLLPSSSSNYLTTLNDNLTAISSSIQAFNQSTRTWVSKGYYTPLETSVLSVIRNASNQTQCDSAIAPNGLACIVYTENNGTTTSYKFAVVNSETGQNIVPRTSIPATAGGSVSGSPRVFIVGQIFIIVFTRLVSATSHLSYVAVSSISPSATNLPTGDISSSYIATSGLSWDGVVVGNNLYVGYDTTSGGQAIAVTYLTLPEALSGSSATTPISFLGYTGTLLSLCVDITASNPSIYVSFYDSGSSTGYTLAVSTGLVILMVPIEIISTGTILNLASSAQNGVCTVFSEVNNVYSYDSSVPTNYINSISVTPVGIPVSFKSVFSSGAGTITASSATGLVDGMYLVDVTTPANLAPNTTFTHSTTTLTLSANTTGNSASSPGDSLLAQTVTLSSLVTVIRSVGLASKAFIIAGTIYFLSAYESSAAAGAGFQPSYFLINGSLSTQSAPIVIGKLAYSNGGGYLETGLPGVSVQGNTVQIPYLFKDLLEAQAQAAAQSINVKAPAVYTQTGVNIASLTFGTQAIGAIEKANTLQLTGGMGWLYDGYLPVEENFLLWPDSVELTPKVSLTPTGTLSNVTNPTIITSVSSTAGIVVGMNVADTTNAGAIPANTTVIAVGASTVTMSAAATAAHSGDSLKFTGNMVPEVGSTYNTFYYQAIYRWTDSQGNVFRSAPSIPVSFTCSAGSPYTFAVVNVPTLRLTYKTNVVIDIYRWSTANPVYYLTTSISAPLLSSTTADSAAFVDLNSDTTILGNEIIYTTGGVIENVNSPASNILTSFDTRCWKVDAEDGNLLWFSKTIIRGVPVEWSDLLTYYVDPSAGTTNNTGPVTAAGPMDDKLILFKGKGNTICYINGTGPDNTGSNNQYPLSPYFVTSAVSSENQASLVLTPVGLMFQANQNRGIWLLDRSLNTQYIGKDVEAFNSSTVTSAVNVPNTTQIRFTLNTGQTLMYDYFYGQWGTFTGIPAISSCIYQGLHTFLNSLGQVYQENTGSYLDGANPVLMSFQTGPIYLAGISGYQRAYNLVLTGSYQSPHILVCQIAFNFGQNSQQYIINPNNPTGYYGSDAVYGQGTPDGGPGSLEQWRIQLQSQQCQSFQLSMNEVFNASLGQVAGAGFTLSGINCLVGIKKATKPFSAAQTVG